MRANEIVQEHLGGFQGALQRSVAVCQDEANAARLSKKSDAEVEKTFNTCLDKATSKFADRLPALQDAISASLKQL